MDADLEALKAAYKEAKAIHREAVKAVPDAKQIADAAHRRATEAFRALNLARPPSKRPKPRPARVEESVFAPSPPYNAG